MELNSYQCRYLGEKLSLRHAGTGVERIGSALHDAQVDINPHQVDAALFAFLSPLQDGVILADEVGLGKTIEAGLVLLQRWSEGARRILIICPSSLRKQWQQELLDKFFLPSLILDSANWKRAERNGAANPFQAPEVVICSYHFAAARAEGLATIPWDLAVLDEAHRVRNVYKTDNKIGRALREALRGRKKLLLTATPLQNSLMELYGLISFVDENAFGDERSFRLRYSRLGGDDDGSYEDLRRRIRPYCHRSLRRQVAEYVRYTQRISITQDFVPGAAEQQLYDLVSGYLQRESLHALPSGQRSLLTLVMRKLLASSTFAISGALESLIRRLNSQLADNETVLAQLASTFADDFEELDDTADELDEMPTPLTEAELASLRNEIGELESLRGLAVSITENAKGMALLDALQVGFAKAADLGAADKAIIFTESKRTQNYLLNLLGENGYRGEIVLFNGSNSTPESRTIYRDWLERNAGTDRISGSATADTRAALVDEFRERARIMIATEAAAEGVNLQFCSLLFNYDLPWNPQRVEQRIGRCHRYGQKHDVVVVNFLNRANAADLRVFELLDQKFQLFSGVFGASDEILGAIESGVDLEQRIVAIYQQCRSSKEITREFDQLQLELEQQIDQAMQRTRQHLLEHFDADVHDRLKVNLDRSEVVLDRLQANLWQLTRLLLQPWAQFDDEHYRFSVTALPAELDDETSSLLGPYQMARFPEHARKFRLGHPLAQWVLEQGRGQRTPDASITIDYRQYRAEGGAKLSRIEALGNASGELQIERFTIVSSFAEERHLLLAAVAEDGTPLDEETAADLMKVSDWSVVGRRADFSQDLQQAAERRVNEVLAEVAVRNRAYFEEALEKLDARAADLKSGLEQSIKELDREIRQIKREARLAADLQTKLGHHQNIAAMERRRNQQRRDLFAAQDEIDADKERLIDQVQTQLATESTRQTLFRLHWTLTTV